MDKEGVPLDMERIVFQGRRLEEKRGIAFYGVVHESKCHMFSNYWGTDVVERKSCRHANPKYLTMRVRPQNGPIVFVGLLSTDHID